MTVLTVFTATLCQDSALSISGLDRNTARQSLTERVTSSGHSFTIVDSTPIILGRGLKGAAVAMARRYFDPLPLSISGPPDHQQESTAPLLRSAWDFSNTRPILPQPKPIIRAGVGILQRTGARKTQALYDREVIPAGSCWPLEFRVDWHLAQQDATIVEGILGYILQEHWAQERCWLGGGVARGFGWCHILNLQAFRLDRQRYEKWVLHGRSIEALPLAETQIPIVSPTRSWCFATRDIQISFGEYTPDPGAECWGVDMLAIGPHASEQIQNCEKGFWAQPWGSPIADTSTDRLLLMDKDTPLLPGSSVRGPLRHAYSRLTRRQGTPCRDPLTTDEPLDNDDPGANLFGTKVKSSRILIRDAKTNPEWYAAMLHHHAEDEFSAGTFESSKRTSTRLLRGTFSVRIVVEGETIQEVQALKAEVDQLIQLGEIGHLPLGGDKTRGAGWAIWSPNNWSIDSVEATPLNQSPQYSLAALQAQSRASHAKNAQARPPWPDQVKLTPQDSQIFLQASHGQFNHTELSLGKARGFSLGKAVEFAQTKLAQEFTAWWCEPAIDFSVTVPPKVFGLTWPDRSNPLAIEEVVFCTATESIRLARCSQEIRWVCFQEIAPPDIPSENILAVSVRDIRARLRQDTTRFCAALDDQGFMSIHEWRTADTSLLGYTLIPIEKVG